MINFLNFGRNEHRHLKCHLKNQNKCPVCFRFISRRSSTLTHRPSCFGTCAKVRGRNSNLQPIQKVPLAKALTFLTLPTSGKSFLQLEFKSRGHGEICRSSWNIWLWNTFFFALAFWGNLGYMIDNMKMKAGHAITLLNFMEKFETWLFSC